MGKPGLILLLLVLMVNRLHGQLQPAENSQLNYRLIPFSFPASDLCEYTLEIAMGNYTSYDSFNQHVFFKEGCNTHQKTAQVPEFGGEYTWQVTFKCYKGLIGSTGLHHFSTVQPTNINTLSNRFRIKKEAEKYSSGCFFSDLNRALYDLQGNMLWYLPDIKGITDQNSDIRDLKVTPQGTITFLTKTAGTDIACEITYTGKILWRTPNIGTIDKDSAEGYHHEFTKLANGHYMILGNETTYWEWQISPAGDSSLNLLATPQGKPAREKCVKILIGTVIEYDKKGKVVWRWKCSDYYRKYVMPLNNIVKKPFDDHTNSFFFDEKKKNIYLSFRNTNEIYKIKYPTGSVTAIYGTGQQPGKPVNLFCDQHSCKISNKGYLYLFNNNKCDLFAPPTILMMREPVSQKGSLEKVWDYAYPIDLKGQSRPPVATWGNVVELPDESMFVSMCLPYGNVFIVNQEKHIVWDAVNEHDNNGKGWEEVAEYRASFIKDRRELERMVWKGCGD